MSLAGILVQAGATVVILGRNRERNQEAVSRLLAKGGKCWASEVDMTDEDAVNQAASAIVAKEHRIDLWVNNVGKSTRVVATEATSGEYRDSLEANFFTTLHGSLAALPHLAISSGHLVNIGSLSSKTAWKYVGPYTVGKHAVAGLTNQLRLEAPENIHVLLVCPGPIAREDSGERYADDGQGLPESARKPGAGAPVKLLDPNQLALRILKSCERRRPELVLPGKARILFAISQLFPRLGNWILNRSQKKNRS